IMGRTVTAIEAAKPPPADAARIRRQYIGPLRSLTAHLGDLAGRAEAAMSKGDEAAAKSLVEKSYEPNADEASSTAFAAAYGMTACAGQ
ncbi:MAG: hypothetical protein ACREJS_12720, partial [Candidatus Rokuibacteriota bacterium]